MEFLFSSWGWLLGLGALAAIIPVLLHLLQTTRAPAVPFSTLRFLRVSAAKTARRRRIHQWLLMLIRASALGLLALALARPSWRAARGASGASPDAAVILLDNSLSMATRSNGQSRLDRAKWIARQLLESRDHVPRGAVIVTNGPLARERGPLVSDSAELERKLDSAEPGIGRADVAGVLKGALQLVHQAGAAEASLYVLSDLQATNWDLDKLGQIVAENPRVPLMIVDCAGHRAANVSVTGLGIEGDGAVAGVPLRLAATVSNGSDEPQDVTVRLQIGAEVIESLTQRVLLSPAGGPAASQVVMLPYTFAQAGWYVGCVQIEAARDDLGQDNVRHFALRIAEPLKVLAVSGGDSAGPRASAYYVEAALNSAASLAQVTVRHPQQVRASELTSADAVVLCNVASVPQDWAEALDAVIARGRAVLVFLGPSVEADGYNRHLAGDPRRGTWLAGQILEPVTRTPAPREVHRVAKASDSSPLVAGLFGDEGSDGSILVYRYFRLKPVDQGRAAVWLEGGDALLIERSAGSAAQAPGYALLCATTADTTWTNFPTRPVFLPLLLRAALRASPCDPRSTGYEEGATVPLLAQGREAEIEVRPPADTQGRQAAIRLPPDPTGPVAFGDTFLAGAYFWQRVDAPQEQGWFVVNGNGDESDLTAVPRQALEQWGSGVCVADGIEQLEQRMAAQRQGRPWWDPLLAIVLVAATVETLVANRYRPAAAQAARGESSGVQGQA